jgi:hypothetical protein
MNRHKTEKQQAADVIEALAGLAVSLLRGEAAQAAPKIEVRDMRAELQGEQPVGYADEFEDIEEIAKLRWERDEARAQLDDWVRRHDAAHGEVLDYRRRLGALESAVDAEAVVQDYTERVRDEAVSAVGRDLYALCLLISDGEHSSYVLATERVKEMKSRLSALQDWQTSISAALECSPANAHDRVRTLQTELKELCEQRKSDSVAGNNNGAADAARRVVDDE